MSLPLQRRDLELADPVWLLTLSWAGKSWRLATRRVELLDADGAAQRYEPELDWPELEEALGELGGAGGEQAIPFDTLYLPGLVDLVLLGWDPSTIRGELALFLDGVHTDLEDRIVVLQGRAWEPVLDEDDRLSFTLQDSYGNDRGVLQAATLQANKVTWSNVADSAKGAPYPIVFGQPGEYEAANGLTDTTTGSPALLVDDSGSNHKLLIAGHRVVATQVTIIDTSDGSSALIAVTHEQDGLGQTVAIADATGSGSLTLDSGHDYWVTWSSTGALPSLDSPSTAMTGAGDLLVYILRRSTLPIDMGRWEPIRAELNAYQLSGYIDDAFDEQGLPLRPVDWVLGNIVDILPLSILQGPQGLYPVLWRYDARPEDAEAVIDVDDYPGMISPASGLVFEGEPLPEFVLHFAQDAARGEFRRTKLLTAVPDTRWAEDAPLEAHNLLESAWLRHVARSGETRPAAEATEAPLVYDEATAGRILAWRVFADALPKRSIRYDVALPMTGWGPGAVLRWTDLDRGLRSEQALVRRRIWGAGALDAQLELVILPNRAHNPYSAS